MREVVGLVGEPRLHASSGELYPRERDFLRSIAVVDELHRDGTIGVGKRGDVQRAAARNCSPDSGCALADETGAEVGVCPQPLRDADFGGIVDEYEGLVVGCVGGAPPVQEAGHVADGEGALDVVRPGEALALAAGGVPVVVDGVKGRPLGYPDPLVGLEGCAGGGAVAVGGDEAEGVFFARLLDTGQAISVLLPSAAVTACDLSLQSRSLESWIENLEEVSSLLARRLHGGVRGRQIGLV